MFVAGGMALAALMCVDESMEGGYKDNDVDIYLYGPQICSPQIWETLAKFGKVFHRLSWWRKHVIFVKSGRRT